MKIVLAYFSLTLGGGERVLSAIANKYASMDNEVTLVLFSSEAAAYHIDKRVQVINVEGKNKSGRLSQRLSVFVHRLRTVRNLLKEIRPDVTLAFSAKQYSIMRIAAIGYKIPVVGSERSNPDIVRKGISGRICIDLISRFCNGYIFLTEGAKKRYPKAVQNKAVVIPNAVFADTVPQQISLLEDREKYSICSVGRLCKIKGFDVLLKAFAEVKKEYEDCKLTIYGDGPDLEHLQKLQKELGLEESVIFFGYCQDIPEQLCKHSMFVLTSRGEGMPNALIEAMACGLPCISTDCSFGPSDLIVNGKNGLLAPVDDIAKLAASMIRILENPIEAQMYADEARAIRISNAPENIFNQYDQYLKKVILKYKC